MSRVSTERRSPGRNLFFCVSRKTADSLFLWVTGCISFKSWGFLRFLRCVCKFKIQVNTGVPGNTAAVTEQNIFSVMAAWLLGCDISPAARDPDVWCSPDKVILWTVRCCGQPSRQAETSGTHYNEEPSHSGQGHPQALQLHTVLQVSTTNSFWEFLLLISKSSFI